MENKKKDYMIEKDRVSIQDNFLPKEEFVALRDIFIALEPLSPKHTTTIPWLYSPLIINNIDEELSTSPGQFFHVVYENNVPTSGIYESHFFPILERLNVHTLTRIRVNLNPRLTEPFFTTFHTDVSDLDVEEFTTSIFYINTCNGYTELEDGTKIENVANRLLTFPLNTKHRGVTQTDEQTRVVINFNYFPVQNIPQLKEYESY